MNKNDKMLSHWGSAKATAKNYNVSYSLIYAVDHLKSLEGNKDLWELKENEMIDSIIEKLEMIVDKLQ